MLSSEESYGFVSPSLSCLRNVVLLLFWCFLLSILCPLPDGRLPDDIELPMEEFVPDFLLAFGLAFLVLLLTGAPSFTHLDPFIVFIITNGRVIVGGEGGCLLLRWWWQGHFTTASTVVKEWAKDRCWCHTQWQWLLWWWIVGDPLVTDSHNWEGRQRSVRRKAGGGGTSTCNDRCGACFSMNGS